MPQGRELLREIPLKPWAGRQREDLLNLMEMLDQQIAPLDQAVAAAAQQNPQCPLADDAAGRGADYFDGLRADPGRCLAVSAGQKQVSSYLGLIPREYSSGGHQRFGPISKQGNGFMRMLLVEAAQVAVRYDPQFRNEYLHRCHQKPKGVAKIARGRLAIRLYWVLRTQKPYPAIVRIEGFSRVPLVVRHGGWIEGLIGRSRPSSRRDSPRRIMAEVRAVSMVDGTTAPKSDSARDVQSLGPPPSLVNARCLLHRKEKLCLDNAFALIEGHPALRTTDVDSGHRLALWRNQAH